MERRFLRHSVGQLECSSAESVSYSAIWLHHRPFGAILTFFSKVRKFSLILRMSSYNVRQGA